jgi:uncharacterized damage-inducible protein DinB
MPVTAARPAKSEYDPYYEKYISLVPDDHDLLAALERQLQEMMMLVRSISPEHALFRYEPGKWSIKEVLGHVIDSERIFAYRILRIARGDRTPIEGFDQDPYVKNGDFDKRSVATLGIEFEQVRRATISLLRHLSPEAWQRIGNASRVDVSVRALAYIIAGHELHHRSILKEKYGLGI